MKKRCPKCKKRKKSERFSLNRTRRDGRQSWCKACQSAARRKRYKEDPEKEKAAAAKYRGKDPEKYRAASRKWQRGNAEKVNGYQKKHRDKNLEKCRATVRKYRNANPEKVRNWQLKTKYGITLVEYNEILVGQNNLCMVCGEALGAPTKGKRYHPVDHDHSKKGRESVRGIVHFQCNIAVGNVEKNPDLYDKVRRYLSNPLGGKAIRGAA